MIDLILVYDLNTNLATINTALSTVNAVTAPSSNTTTISGGYVKIGRQITVTVKFTVVATTISYAILLNGLLASIAPGSTFECRNANGTIVTGIYIDTTMIYTTNALPTGTYVINGSYISAV